MTTHEQAGIKVSVVIPVHNTGPYPGECLELTLP